MFARSLFSRLPSRAVAASFKRFNSSLLLQNRITAESIVAKYSSGPLNVKYTQEHEWLAAHPDGTAFVGITKYAADALGDATYIELPEITEDVTEQGDSIGSVESVKSASEIYSPIEGQLLEVNEQLNENPELINKDPMGAGWIVKMKLVNESELNERELMDEESYVKFLQEHEA